MKRREFIQKCAAAAPFVFLGGSVFGQSGIPMALRKRDTKDWIKAQVVLPDPLLGIVKDVFMSKPAYLTGGCVLGLTLGRNPRTFKFLIDAGSEFSLIKRKLGRAGVVPIPSLGMPANQVAVRQGQTILAMENLPLDEYRQRIFLRHQANEVAFAHDGLLFDLQTESVLDPLEALSKPVRPAMQANSLLQSTTVLIQGHLDVLRYDLGAQRCLDQIEADILPRNLSDHEALVATVTVIDAVPELEELDGFETAQRLIESPLLSGAIEKVLQVDSRKACTEFKSAYNLYGNEFSRAAILIALLTARGVRSDAPTILETCYLRAARFPNRFGAVSDGIGLAKRSEFQTRFARLS